MRLVFFHAPWCAVCHHKAPVARAVAGAAGLPLDEVDVDSAGGAATAEARRIRTVPTLALVDGERVRFRLVGRMITPENFAHLMERIRA